MGREETEHRHFPKDTKAGLWHPPVLHAAALTTERQHLASSRGARASLAEKSALQGRDPSAKSGTATTLGLLRNFIKVHPAHNNRFIPVEITA